MRCEPQIGECILRDIDALISSAQTSHPRWHDSIFWHSEKCLLWLKNVNLKNKKQCETARGFPLVTVLSPLHWTQSTNSRKRAGLWLRCEQAPPMWVWRHCLAASCQERKKHMTALEKGANRLGGILTYTTVWKLFLTPVLTQDVCCCVAMKQCDSSVCVT